MPTLISAIETTARLRLQETSASFWTSAELVEIIIAGIRDLWRDIADLKAEHFLKIDTQNVNLQASTDIISGVPNDVHKVYLIAPRDVPSTSSNGNMRFMPMEFNSDKFQGSRASDNVDPQNAVIYYAVTGAGAPVVGPTIYVAPKVTSPVNLLFAYVPSLGALASTDYVPIPGEADNALVAWTVAFALAKEREDRAPDPGWLAILSTEKQHLLQSLGLRQYQEPTKVDAVFEEYWN